MIPTLIYLLIAGVALIKFWYWFTRRPVCYGGKHPGQVAPRIEEVLANPDQIQYNLKDVITPVTYGWKLKLLVWFSFTRLGRLLLVPWIFKLSGSNKMRSMYLPEEAVFYPIPLDPLSGKKCSKADRDHSRANSKIIEKLVNQEIKDPKREGFHFPTVADFVRAYKSGEVTPTDVAKAVLDAIADSDKANPPLRAIVQSNRDHVMKMAEASTQRWHKNEPLSLLDGVPVAVKEEFRVEPYAFRSGAEFVPKMATHVLECVAVEKLMAKGAVIIGVANLQEFGTGTLGSNPNKDHLTARNPYNPQCYPGGSSSGSAVSVAVGFCPIALGTDGGGSVRIPAVTCGVVGLKPTFRLVDSTGILPLSYSVGVTGPLCSSVLDMAIAMNVITKETDGDKNPLSLEGLGERRLDGMNIGVYWEYFEHADSEVVSKCKAAVSKLESLGANIVKIKIPELDEARVAHSVSITSEFSTSLLVDTDPHFKEINLETLLVLTGGYQFSAVHYLNAQKQRARLIKVLEHFFKERKLDAIVTPGCGCLAPKINPKAISEGSSDLKHTIEMMRFAFMANLAGNPGLVVPVGYSKDGLPIGLQVMGGWYQEHTLLKIGWALENSGAFPLKKPRIFYDVLKKSQ